MLSTRGSDKASRTRSVSGPGQNERSHQNASTIRLSNRGSLSGKRLNYWLLCSAERRVCLAKSQLNQMKTSSHMEDMNFWQRRFAMENCFYWNVYSKLWIFQFKTFKTDRSGLKTAGFWQWPTCFLARRNSSIHRYSKKKITDLVKLEILQFLSFKFLGRPSSKCVPTSNSTGRF